MSSSLADASGGMQRVGQLLFSDAKYRGLYHALIDEVHGYAYFATASSINPGWIIKVDLKGPLPVEVGAVACQPGEFNLIGGVIDVAAGYAYFGTTASPGRVVKIALGAGNAPPTYVGSIPLDLGETSAWGAVIDTRDPNPANHYAYFATSTAPGKIVKVALGAGNALPTRLGAITLNPGEDHPRRGVVDLATGYAYFATATPTIAPKVIKVALGAGAALPTRVGAVTLDATAHGIGSAVIDPTNGYAYFGTYDSVVPAQVYKVALGAGSAPPTLIGVLTLNPGERELCSAVIDPAGGYAYFGTDHTYPGKIYKIALGTGTALPTEVGALQLNSGTNPNPPDGQNVANNPASLYGEVFLQSAVIDLAHGYAYFGTDSAPGQVVKVALGQTSPPPNVAVYLPLVQR